MKGLCAHLPISLFVTDDPVVSRQARDTCLQCWKLEDCFYTAQKLYGQPRQTSTARKQATADAIELRPQFLGVEDGMIWAGRRWFTDGEVVEIVNEPIGWHQKVFGIADYHDRWKRGHSCQNKSEQYGWRCPDQMCRLLQKVEWHDRYIRRRDGMRTRTQALKEDRGADS